MRARALGARGWAFGLGLLAAVLACSARAERGLDVPPPEEPPGFVLDEGAAAQARVVAGETAPAQVDVTVPDPPEAAVHLDVPEPTRTAAIAAPEPEAAAPQVDPLWLAIADRLADPKLPLPARLTPKDGDALAAAYAARSHQPLWLDGAGGWSTAARAVMEVLGRADEHGLDPTHYPVPQLPGGTMLSRDELAEAEVKLSLAAYLYARDARGGRLEPRRLSPMITPSLALPTATAVLAALAATEDPRRALERFHPPYPGYQALKRKLAAVRANRPDSPGAIAPREGRARQAALAAVASDALPPRMGRAPNPRLEGDIIANMERWRWLPSNRPPRYVSVNVPEFRLRVVEDGLVVHETRVITGKPATPTPVFTGMIDHAIVNPSWYVPQSILRKQFGGNLPGSVPGFSIVRRGKHVTVRQPPGPTNALGYIKFMFPNDHAVYLHDTPNRNLFGAAQRALSHGCVRVEHPFALGGKILGPDWTEAKLKKLIGWGERMIKLSDRIPVNLTYFTLSVDEAGEMTAFSDIYGYHRRVRVALGLGA